MKYPDRRIEFVGDSITAGLDVVKVGKLFTLAAENNRLDYSAVAARRLGAESICIAYSGNGVHCDGGGDLHPDVANQRKMADLLVKAIAAETGWTFAEEDAESGDRQ